METKYGRRPHAILPFLNQDHGISLPSLTYGRETSRDFAVHGGSLNLGLHYGFPPSPFFYFEIFFFFFGKRLILDLAWIQPAQGQPLGAGQPGPGEDGE